MIRAVWLVVTFVFQVAAFSPVSGTRSGVVHVTVAAQFGGRTGCCVKADSYLSSLTRSGLSASRPSAPCEENLWQRDWVWLLDDSLRRLHGSAILPAPRASASHCASLAANQELVCVSHDFESSGEAGPIFNYATAAGLTLFEMSWDQFVNTPSRMSAEADETEERARILDRVLQYGFTDNYSGIRVSRTGRRFRIRNAIVWNVDDGAGNIIGQAALFRRSEVDFL